MKHVFATVLAGVSLCACSRDDKVLTVGEVQYAFPAKDVFRFIAPTEGHSYARIRPEGGSFDLVYSKFMEFNRNWESPDAPPIYGINTMPSRREFRRFDTAGTVVICRDGGPHFTCGMRIDDEGVPWSILFDEKRVTEAKEIQTSATLALRRYRRLAQSSNS